MKMIFFTAATCFLLLSSVCAAAGNVEVDGSLNITGTPTIDGITFPDSSKQTTAATATLYQKRVSSSCSPAAISAIDSSGGVTCQTVGSVTNVVTGSGLQGGPITGTGTISIAPSGVTNTMLANPSITVNTGSGLSGGATVSLGGAVSLSVSSINLSSQVSGSLAVANGGTGTTTIAGARAAICPGYTAPAKAPVQNSGQKTTYRAGDDGNWQTGAGMAAANRFTDNGNYTVTDNLTGLIWLKNANCFGGQNWLVALAEANSLASGTCSLSDGSAVGDWRLPNHKELKSLIDYSRSASPTLPSGHPFTNLQSSDYWSSTTYASGTTLAWGVDMTDGVQPAYGKIGAIYVWPVRGNSAGKGRLPKTGETSVSYGTGSDGTLQKGIAWPNPRFTDNGDGTVTDNLTGLIWLKNANCISANWTGALAGTISLASGACGLTDGSTAGDWRLPSVTELESLIDVSKSNPPIPAGHPFSLSTGFYWSSTTYAPNTGSAWGVGMSDGYVSIYSKVNTYFVWPVRGGQ